MESSTAGRTHNFQTDRPPIKKSRRVLPQILAITAINLVEFNIGLMRSFPTILIAALKGLNVDRNPNEFIKISSSDSTWLASVYTLCMFFGNLFFNFLSEPLGRKKSIILVNIPFAVGWIMLSYSNNLPIIFVSLVILCFGASFVLTPVHNYIGEICDPSVRGILTASNCTAVALGYLLNYSLANVIPWRMVASIYIAIPIASAATMCCMPESPSWLLLRNRQAHAEESLRWLRGWVNEDAIRDEFSDLKRFQAIAQQCCECEKNKVICNHPPPSVSDQIRQLLHRRTFHPLVLMFVLYFLAYFGSYSALRPYYVQVLYYYESPIDPNVAVSYAGWIDVIASATALVFIRSFGKKKVYFWSLGFSILFTFAIAIYGFIFLSNDLTSFEITPNSYLRSGLSENFRYIPLVLIFLLTFIFTFGIIVIPWCLICEVFSFRTKGLAIGLTLSIENAVAFISSKTFYALEMWLALPGLLFFYGTIAVIGFIGLYFTMPETEGRTLEEIEHFFSNTQRKLYDTDIPKISKDIKNHQTTESIE